MTFSPKHWRFLAFLWTFGIIAACSIPGRSLPPSGLFEFDKVIHVIFFAGFGLLWLLAARTPLRVRLWRVLLAGLAFAVLTELYQGILPFERFPDPYDVIANVSGLVAALAAYGWWHRRRAARNTPA